MYWTLELATKLEDAPWPATKDELIDYAVRSGAPLEVIENLQEIEDEGDTYESIEDIWEDYPRNDEDFFFDGLGPASVRKLALRIKVVNKGSSLKRDTLLGEKELPLTSLLPFL